MHEILITLQLLIKSQDFNTALMPSGYIYPNQSFNFLIEKFKMHLLTILFQ